MTGRTAYINARLIDPASGTDAPGGVLIEGNKILNWGPGLFNGGAPEDARIVDCQEYCLAPGLIDMRVHLPEPGGEHKESFESASAAAAAGGVTSIVCLPDADTPIDNISVLEFIARRARETNIVKIYAYGTITRNREGGELSEFSFLSEAGALAFTDGDRALADALVMRRALSYAATFDLLIVQHPEEPRLARNGQMNEGEMATRLGLAGIPACAEVMMIERDLRLVELTGARYHARVHCRRHRRHPAGKKPRPARDLRYGAALFHAERQFGNGLPDLHQGLSPAARRSGPACGH